MSGSPDLRWSKTYFKTFKRITRQVKPVIWGYEKNRENSKVDNFEIELKIILLKKIVERTHFRLFSCRATLISRKKYENYFGEKKFVKTLQLYFLLLTTFIWQEKIRNNLIEKKKRESTRVFAKLDLTKKLWWSGQFFCKIFSTFFCVKLKCQ